KKKIPIERVRVIPVDVATFLEREMRKVAVIAVHVDESHRHLGKRLGDVSRDGGFAGTSAARNTDDQWLHARVSGRHACSPAPQRRREIDWDRGGSEAAALSRSCISIHCHALRCAASLSP